MDSKAEKQEVISSIVGNTIRGDATVSCNTATTIPTSSSRNNGNTDSDGIRKKRLRMRGPKPLYEFISSTADDPKWEIQGKNAATLFATYQAQAAEKQLYLECDVQKILSLSNMLMPEPKQQNTLGVSIFGSGTLKAAHSKFLLRLGFDKSSTNQRNNAKSSLLNIVEALKDEQIDCKTAIKRLSDLQYELSDHEALYRAIDAIVNRVKKLVRDENALKVGEMELITSFLDPIISSMFHNPDKSKIFKWTDQAISEDLDVLDPSRLDCCFLLLEESSSTCPLMLNQREEEQVEKTNMSARLKSRYFRE